MCIRDSSLNPQINMWEVARPIVEEYIRKSIGPRAVLRDLGKTALVISRFGPKLPDIVEAALLREAQKEPEKTASRGWLHALGYLGAAILGGLLVIVASEFF